MFFRSMTQRPVSVIFTHLIREAKYWLKLHVFSQIHRGAFKEFLPVTNTRSNYERGKTEMIYSRLKRTNVPQDHGGPHTENQDRPFMKPIQAAQTGPEACEA